MKRKVWQLSSLAALVAFVWACGDEPLQPDRTPAPGEHDAPLVSTTSAGTMVTAPPIPEAILRALAADPVPDDPALIDEEGDPFGLDGRIPRLGNERPVSLDAPGPPPPTCTDCQQYQGTLTGPGDVDLQPAGSFYFHSAGTHHAWLDGPSEANLDVYLMQFNFAQRQWKFRAFSVQAASDEEVVYTGSAGYYVWLVYSRSGGGPYDFWLQTTGDPFATVPPETLVGAGDIADCNFRDDVLTAALLDQIPGTVFTVGDNAYPNGTPQEYLDCYDPSWGRHFNRTNPTPGNHDYFTPGAAGYFGYFGSRAGTPGEGWYSYDLGAWHIVALNSNIDVAAGSPQLQWLEADLAANPSTCTLAYWHHPRFSSGLHGNDVAMQDIWDVLYAAGADVVLSGHDHIYERFARQRPDEVADPAQGIRQFTVGTGGGGLAPISIVKPNSEVRYGLLFYGVLKLTLYEMIYDWEFIPQGGATILDAGSAVCH